MLRYILKRFIQVIPVLIGVSVVVFLLLRVFAPDPAPIVLGQHASNEMIEAWRESHGLNAPIWKQFLDFFFGALRGDFGTSYYSNTPVWKEIIARFPATIELSVLAMIFASLIGIFIGVISAVRKNSFIDNASMVIALIGVSIPIFWSGIMLIIVFAGHLEILPSGGRISPLMRPETHTGLYLIDTLIDGNISAFKDAVQHLVLPVIALGMYSMAIIARMTRSTMLDTLNQDYIRTARAKGLSKARVVFIHALRNAMIPITTVIGLQLGQLLGGSVLTETVFAWPGIGKFTVDSLLKSDFPVVQAVVLLIAIIFVMMNLLVDIIYAFLDPRIKYSGGKED